MRSSPRSSSMMYLSRRPPSRPMRSLVHSTSSAVRASSWMSLTVVPFGLRPSPSTGSLSCRPGSAQPVRTSAPCRLRRCRRWPGSWRHEDAMVASLPRLNLSLAPQWFRLFRAAQWIMVLLIAGSLSLSAWSWWHSRSLEADAAQYQLAAGRVEEMNRHFIEEAARAGVDLADERLKTLPREVAFTNQLLEQRAFSWTRFLNDLEEAVPPSVHRIGHGQLQRLPDRPEWDGALAQGPDRPGQRVGRSSGVPERGVVSAYFSCDRGCR